VLYSLIAGGEAAFEPPEGIMIVGIDIGSTTTKAVAIESGRVARKMKTRAADAVTSATGVLGKLTMEGGLGISDIERISITGVGAAKIREDIFGIPTKSVGEITAIGRGGMFLSGRDEVLIANIGTGTAIIEARGGRIAHIGGTGVGGGTIAGLAKQMLNTSSFSSIMALAEKGHLGRVDLLIGDIAESGLGFLGGDVTAANFGKMTDGAGREDIALGLINMTYQVIGMLSVFAARSAGLDSVVVTGKGSGNALGQKVLAGITDLYKTEFSFPEDAEFATAIGAAING